MAAVAALYAYDSALLLHANEAVLVRDFGGRWRAGFGSTSTTFRGRQLWMPNLLAPMQPLFRLLWSHEHADPRAASDLEQRSERLAFLAPWVIALFVALFGVLPLALFGGLGDLAIVAAFALGYGLVLLMAALVWLRREGLGLEGRAALALMLDLLLCPPFALNLVRRLSLRQALAADFVASARVLLDAPAWQHALEQLQARQDDEIALEDEHSVRKALLLRRRAQLAEPE